MSNPDHFLVASMARLDEERVLFLVERGLAAGAAPYRAPGPGPGRPRPGGRALLRGRYFLADLLMAAHIFRQVLDRLFDAAPVAPDPNLPPVIFGTVQGDIHEIGKNITIAFMRYNGLRIIDLGGNVPPQRFVEEVRTSQARIVCLSGLMTSCYGAMRKTVAALGKAGLRGSTTVIIGGQVSEALRQHVGADYWVEDYVQGVEICRTLLTQTRRPEPPLAARS
ncbi:MAG: cobalamin-dependent protein [Thermoleophilia bacterium]|nr:cobalamin-dependent protein [Thermoleophilia bacterium]